MEKLYKLIVEDKKEPRTIIQPPQAVVKSFSKDVTKAKSEIVLPDKFHNSFELAINKAIYKMWIKSNSSRRKIFANKKILYENLF